LGAKRRISQCRRHAPSVTPQAGGLWFDSVGGQLYVWYVDPNTSQWVPATNQVGGGYATIAYVNSLPTIGDNRIINGDMRIDQRNGGASGTAINAYTADRWKFWAVAASKGSWRQTPGATVPGFPYCLGFTSSSAYALVAGDYFLFGQFIEAEMISDFAFGTANAQPITLSFWAYSSLGGTFGGTITNSAQNRSYPFSYALVAATWTKVVITIPGDTTGTWSLTGVGSGLALYFAFGVGTTYSAPSANSWQAGTYFAPTGSVSVVGTNGATFYVTGVKLEVGSVATPYNRQSLAKSMADCQRYFQKLGGSIVADILLQGNATAAGANGPGSSIGYAPMRAAPTGVIVGTFTLTNASSATLFPGIQTIGLTLQASAAGFTKLFNPDTNTYITLNAEL
jgi:hypothetical protein